MLEYTMVRTVDLGVWDELVMSTYGRVYSFQQQDGCKSRGQETFKVPRDKPWDYANDTIEETVNGEEMGVSFKAWLERDPNQKLDTDDEWDREHGLELFWERNFYPSLDMVAQDLFEKGLIEEGEYTIVIDW